MIANEEVINYWLPALVCETVYFFITIIAHELWATKRMERSLSHTLLKLWSTDIQGEALASRDCCLLRNVLLWCVGERRKLLVLRSLLAGYIINQTIKIVSNFLLLFIHLYRTRICLRHYSWLIVVEFIIIIAPTVRLFWNRCCFLLLWNWTWFFAKCAPFILLLRSLLRSFYTA